mgnify:CR=1 FL=1
MRRALLLLMVVLMLMTLPAAFSPEQIRRDNRRLLEDWRADAVHRERLQHDLTTFWNLSQKQREQIRKLDQGLHQLEPDRRAQLIRVMDRYYEWFQRLPNQQRQYISQAGSTQERLKRVKEIREKQWLARLPKRAREQLADANPTERAQIIQQLKQEEKEWRKNWWIQFRPSKLEELPRDVQLFTKEVLLPLLPPERRQKLLETQQEPHPAFVRALYREGMSVRGRTKIPGPVGPVYLVDLPKNLQEWLNRDTKAKSRLTSVEGRWPEFGVALQEVAPRELLPKLSAKQFPARFKNLPKLVQRFVTSELKPKLNDREQRQLRIAEGAWPRYPFVIQKLSRAHKLRIPGMALPRIRDLWAKGKLKSRP